jgi:hypothetical protein
VKWENSVWINCSVDRVFAFVTDPTGGSQWHRANNIVPISDEPIGVGSTFRVTGKFLWWSFDSVSEVTEFIKNERVSYRSVTGMYTYHLRYILEPIDGGT